MNNSHEFAQIDQANFKRNVELNMKVLEARKILQELSHMVDQQVDSLNEDYIKIYESDFHKMKVQAETIREKFDR